MAISRGQITIVDLNDAKSLNLYLNANQPTTQIFNRENSSYVPDYTTSPLVITPELYVSGTSDDLIGRIKPNPKWYINGSDNLAAFGATVATASPYKLTINNNMTKISQMKVECEVIFVDPVTLVETKSKSVMTFTKTENAGQLITAISYAPNGTIFKQGVERLKAHCDLWRGSKIDDTNVNYKWFKLATDGTWTELNDTTNFGIKGYTTNEITIPSSAVLNFETFKCEITDKDTSSGTYDTKVSDIISFADLTDPYQIVMVSPDGDKIVNGRGSIKITAEIWQKGEKLSDDALSKFYFTWKKFDKDGNQDKNWKPNGSGAGQIITVTAADISIKATFVLEITLKQ